MPITAVLTGREAFASLAPHPVATIGMPANEETGTRIPAVIGIGCCEPNSYTAMVLSSDAGDIIPCGQTATLILEKRSSLAVTPNGSAM
jgi:hypothetical protein